MLDAVLSRSEFSASWAGAAPDIWITVAVDNDRTRVYYLPYLNWL